MQQGVVDQARVHGFLNPCPVHIVQLRRHCNLNVEVVHTRRILLLLGHYPNPRALRRQLVLAQVLRSIESSARSQRRRQQFRRRHAFVVAATLPRLIRYDRVGPSLDFELTAPRCSMTTSMIASQLNSRHF
jgi:hypothetical protein